MTGDEYVQLLLDRQAAHLAEHPPAKPWLLPLLESFIQPGDEDLVDLPTETPQPKRERAPRRYRSAASLREERDRLVARRAAAEPESLPDRAAVGGNGIGRKQGLRYAAQMDRALQRCVELDRRISALNGRIARAEARERRAAL